MTIGDRTDQSPISLNVPRTRGQLIVRATKPGYVEACRVATFQTNRLLVALDAIPLALGLLVDKVAGTWPGNYPAELPVSLQEGSEAEFQPLPSDADMRRSGTAQCTRLRARSVNVEKWTALFRPSLLSASVDGKKLPISRERDEGGEFFSIEDGPVTITVASTTDSIQLSVENGGSRSVKLHWDDAVFIDFDRTSKPLGRGDLQSDSLRVPSVIAPGTAIDETVFPMSRVYEQSTAVRTTDPSCVQQCQQVVYQCMTAYNCSGYRSGQPYQGNYAALYAIAAGLDAGLCERRCAAQYAPCASFCGREVKTSEGWRKQPIVPSLLRGCGQSETAFTQAAMKAQPGRYGILIPIEAMGTVREYLLTFQAELDHFEEAYTCPAAAN